MNSATKPSTASYSTLEQHAKSEQLSARKRSFLSNSEEFAGQRDSWIAKNKTYYADEIRYLRFLIPENSRVLDIGCGTGKLLAALKPSYGVGIDFSPAMIERARNAYPNLHFFIGDAEDPSSTAGISVGFDYIVLSDTIGAFDDIEEALKGLHRFCSRETRIVIAYYSSYWAPIISIATKFGWRMPQPPQNLLSVTDFLNILNLSDFESIRMEWRQILPIRLFGIGRLVNRFIAPLPLIRNFCLRAYIVARAQRAKEQSDLSTSILIPCRNEEGNIERAIREMPRFGAGQEIIFVVGESRDKTFEECRRVQETFAVDWAIKVLKQEGKGKGGAVRQGLAAASGDILMILDGDLTVPARSLPKFYDAIVGGKGEFINGTRLVYPMENEAMRFLNHIANRMFALIFSYLLNQRFTDTLCGTKVVRRVDYERMAKARSYFGDFDPFGDFDLIFGAAKQNLRIIEVPIHYKARTYGETQISRFRDGWLLIRMVVFAYMKLKAI